MPALSLISNASLFAKARREMLDNVEHLVVPAIAIKEGVLNDVFYPAEELSEMVESWNGVPVPVSHPMEEGIPISANTVKVENTSNIGRFYNVVFEDGAIKGEIWINIEKATRLGFANIIELLEGGEQMEVSTGLLAFTDENEGKFNGVDYSSIINSIRPDHLALLPNEKGACSIEDGCGAMRTNKKECQCNKFKKPSKKYNWFQKLLKPFHNKEQSHEEIRDKIREALRPTLSRDDYPWIVNVYSNYFIYELNNKTYKRDYSIDSEANSVTLLGITKEVTVEISYEVISNQTDMTPEHRTTLVNALASAMGDSSKVGVDQVAELPDTMLTNMASQYKLNVDGTPLQEPTPSNAPADKSSDRSTLSVEERTLLNSLKQERDQRLANKRTKVVEIHDHIANADSFDEPALDALLGVVKTNTTANYAPAGGVPPVTNSKQSYKPLSVFLKNKKEASN